MFEDEIGFDDEVGYDDIVGALEDLDPAAAQAFEVGSRARRRRILGAVFGGPAGAIAAAAARRRQRNQARRAAAANPRQALSTPRGIVPATDRQVPLGLGIANVTANATAILSAVVQRPMQPRRLVLSSSGLASFIVNDIKIGSMSQLAGVDQLPAELFSDVAVGTGVLFTPASSGITVSVTVTNTSNGVLAISGAMLGASSEV